jgi:predicted RNA binding protein with dsRBD fold (UPF0201 family)
LKASLSAELNPTESAEKLVAAIRGIFPDAELSVQGNEIRGSASLAEFARLAEQQKIRHTIEDILLGNLSSGKTFVPLSKLAACAGKIGVDVGFPLGDIRLELECTPDEITGMLFPKGKEAINKQEEE